MPALPLLSSSSGCKTVGRSGEKREKKESGGNKVFEEKGWARNVEKACLELQCALLVVDIILVHVEVGDVSYDLDQMLSASRNDQRLKLCASLPDELESATYRVFGISVSCSSTEST